MRLPLLPVALICCSSILGACGGGGATAGSMNAVPTASPSPGPFQFSAPAGLFYKDYTGPKRPALDLIGASGVLISSSQTIEITAKLAGPVFAGGPNYYVFAFDTSPPRLGCPGCPGPFPDDPNILFTVVAVILADPANGGTLNGYLGGFPDPIKSEPATLVAPDTVRIDVPAADLASLIPAEAVRWTVWARSGFLTFQPGTTEVASFLPDNALATLFVR